VDKIEGNTYESRITAPKVKGKKVKGPKAATAKAKGDVTVKYCQSCKNYGHQRKSSGLCPNNKNNLLKVGPVGTCVL
jgi:hypothetical protein